MGMGLSADQASKVIEGRPWTRKDQLKSKGIVTDQEYQSLTDKMIAKQK